MADDDKPVIHVKRIKKVAGGHHGGAWKIAYADFVTAMMAFFLLMWLLGSTSRGDLKGISDYFSTPLKVAMSGGSGSGDSSSVIKGGGKDLTRSEGQINKSERPGKKKTIDIKAAEAERARRETEHLKGLQLQFKALINNSTQLKAFTNQLLLDITSEGLRIQIVDEKNRPMFDTGSAQLKDYTRSILRELAPLMNSVENKISLSGHTDAAPFASGDRGYSNWELSADRANSSRRELVLAGLDEHKIIRVVGLASASLLDPADPLNSVNRRISIVVVNKNTADNIQKEGAVVEISNASDIKGGMVNKDVPQGTK